MTVTGIVVVLTGSRAGWLGIVGAALVVGGLWLLVAGTGHSRGRARAGRGSRSRRRVRCARIARSSPCWSPPWWSYRRSCGGWGPPATVAARHYFTVALRMFSEAPLLGTGPGTWAVQRAAYTEPSEFDCYIPHAHDVYLQTLAELGIVGLLAGALALPAVAWLILRGLRGEATSASAAGAGRGRLPSPRLPRAPPGPRLLPEHARRHARGGHPRRDPGRHERATSRARAWTLARRRLPALPGPHSPVRPGLPLARLPRRRRSSSPRAESVARAHDQAVERCIRGRLGPPAQRAGRRRGRRDPDMAAYQITRGLVASARALAGRPRMPTRSRRAGRRPAPELARASRRRRSSSGDRPRTSAGPSIEPGASATSSRPSSTRRRAVRPDGPRTDEANAAYAVSSRPCRASRATRPGRPTRSLASRCAGIRTRPGPGSRSGPGRIALVSGDADAARVLAEASDRPDLATTVIDAWTGDGAALAAVLRAGRRGSG